MTGYIGIGGTAKKVKNIYVGVGGVAKKVKKGYIGVGGVAKQWYSALPTLEELFSTAALYSSTAAGWITGDLGVTIAQTGTFYSIFTSGGALCITRTIITLPVTFLEGDLTTLVSITASGVSPMAIDHADARNGVTIYSTSSLRGVHYLVGFDNTYPDEVISYVLQNAPKECLLYYNSSSASPSSGEGVGYSVDEAASKKGYLYAAWASNATSAKAELSLSKCNTPLNGIVSIVNGASADFCPLTINNGNIYPSTDGSAIARTRCYSLFRFEDV